MADSGWAEPWAGKDAMPDAAIAQAIAWHRQVAAMVEAADRAGVATADLPALRVRLAAQAATLARAATRTAGPLPALLPTPAEIASAGPTLGDLSAGAAAGAIATMSATLDSVDATLHDPARASEPAGIATDSGAPAPPPAGPVPAQAVPTPPPAVPTPVPQPAPAPRPPAVRRSVAMRNAGIYGAYSAAVLVVQALLFLLLDESRQLPSAAPLCLLVLPAMAWSAGYITISVVSPPGPDGKLRRTPRLGAVVCLIPDVLLVAWVGVLFLVNL